MHIANFKEIITFQRTTDGGETYTDYYTCHAYLNGMTTSEFFQTKPGGEFYMDYAGTEGQVITTIVCRYQKAISDLNPMQYRIKHVVGDKEMYYQLLTPPDDVQLKHERIKFRARRIWNLEGEENDETDSTDDEG
jgi:hypothetical protein